MLLRSGDSDGTGSQRGLPSLLKVAGAIVLLAFDSPAAAQLRDEGGYEPMNDRRCYLQLHEPSLHFEAFWNSLAEDGSCANTCQDASGTCTATCSGDLLCAPPDCPADQNGDCLFTCEDVADSSGRFYPAGRIEYIGDATEGDGAGEATDLLTFFECALTILTNPPRPDGLAFAEPSRDLPSNHLDAALAHIPIWVRGCGEGGAATPHPRLAITPNDGLFSIDDPAGAPEYDANAVHELAHVVLWSYNRYLNRSMPFLTEGLPTFLEIPLTPSYSPDRPWLRCYDFDPVANTWCPTAAEAGSLLTWRIDVSSRHPLRTHAYGFAAPFWYDLATTYSNVATSDELWSALTPECRTYSERIDLPTRDGDATPWVRQVPGLDVILHVEEELAACHPEGERDPYLPTEEYVAGTCYCGETAAGCPSAATREALSVHCSTGPADPGCVPAVNEFDPPFTEHEEGEAYMPVLLDLVDTALRRGGRHPEFDAVDDGLRYVAFRRFLLHNYLLPGDPAWPLADEVARDGTVGYFRLKSFGAHYHELTYPAGARAGGGILIDVAVFRGLSGFLYGGTWMPDDVEVRGHVFYMRGDEMVEADDPSLSSSAPRPRSSCPIRPGRTGPCYS